MRKLFILFTIVLSVSFVLIAQDYSRESENIGTAVNTVINSSGWVYESPEAVLYDNGPYFNSPGGGPGGADGSVLQNTTLLMTTLGAGHQLSALNRVADDFVIPVGESWTINSASFYAYQTGSTTTSTMNHVNLRIWDGPPGAVGSNVVFGDTATNRMTATVFTNCYRYSENAVGTTRPIMKQTASVGVTLPAGTYWIDWQTGGTLASGPWAPPIAILGQTTTGNAMQSIAGVWANLVDGGTLTPQGLPFILDGSIVIPPLFFDNFDTYTAGNLIACSNPTFWTTWSNAPCGAEDGVVSNLFSYSAPNSGLIVQNDDLVKDFGAAYTTGKYKISFQCYIGAGKAGYFNTLSAFAGASSSWGMECYFNTTAICSVFAGSTTAVTGSYPQGAWFPVEVIVDLGTDQAQLNVNGNLITTWQWTLGSNGAGGPLTLDANDFFGATANDQMYFDDYTVENLTEVPVELTSFNAQSNNGKVNLNWTTATEINNNGFEVQRRSANESNYLTVGQVRGNGTTTEVKHYSFVDQPSKFGQYYYRLKQVDFNGTYEFSNEVFAEISAPAEFTLSQNYPNPFNPTTNIAFSLAEPTFVKLVVYNLLGEVVQTLKNENMAAGSYNITFDASALPSGMYLYKIETAQFNSVMKMMLMK